MSARPQHQPASKHHLSHTTSASLPPPPPTASSRGPSDESSAPPPAHAHQPKVLRLPEQEDDQPLDLGAPTKRRASPEPDAGQPTTKSMKPEETKASEEQERSGPAGSSPVKGGYVHKLKKAWIKEYTTKDDADQDSNSTGANLDLRIDDSAAPPAPPTGPGSPSASTQLSSSPSSAVSALHKFKKLNAFRISSNKTNGMSSPATMSSNSSVSGGGDDEDNGGSAEDKKHRKFRKKRLGRPPKEKHSSPARYPKRSRTANNNSADNSDEDVNDDTAVSARGGAGTESNSCVGEVIDSDSSSRKSEVRLAYVMMKIFL